MKLFISRFPRYAEYQFTHTGNMVGLDASCKSFIVAAIANLLWFEQPYNHQDVVAINLRYRELLLRSNPQLLSQTLVEMETKSPFIHRVMQKIENKAKVEGIDTGFNPGSWAPGIIAVEVI